MREILFRGKRVDNGEWIKGNLIEIDYIFKQYFILAKHSQDKEPVLVIPESVGQFTGITDKNGVKIFEGDIVMPKVGHYIVKFNLTSLQWVIEHKSGDHITSLGYNQLIEIVGNIHEK